MVLFMFFYSTKCVWVQNATRHLGGSGLAHQDAWLYGFHSRCPHLQVFFLLPLAASRRATTPENPKKK